MTRAFATAVLLVCTNTLHGQSLEQRLQYRLDSLHRAGRFIGATVGVVLADGRRLSFASGLSDTAQRTPLRADHRMLAGSTGKTFFAALAYQLAREGRLPLDAPISRWLGNEAWFDSLPNARQITIRQLMNHTSGLVRYELNPRFLADLIAQPNRAFSPVEELRYLFGSTAAFAAGQGWDYSDTNYIVLAMILERITGTRAYDEIGRRFLEPLRLTGTIPSDRRELPGLAQGYAGRNNPFGALDAMVRDGRFAINPQFEWAGGGFASTAPDLAQWARALYSGGVVDTAFLRAEILQGVLAPMLGQNARYGLGVIIRETLHGITWGHSGFFPGYLTEVRWYAQHGVAIAVMVNQNQPARGPGGLVSDLAAELFAQPPPGT
ncbi:MAG: serine hydrolase domain-containing protein [Gemmatimonadaceae bacterium]